MALEWDWHVQLVITVLNNREKENENESGRGNGNENENRRSPLVGRGESEGIVVSATVIAIEDVVDEMEQVVGVVMIVVIAIVNVVIIIVSEIVIVRMLQPLIVIAIVSESVIAMPRLPLPTPMSMRMMDGPRLAVIEIDVVSEGKQHTMLMQMNMHIMVVEAEVSVNASHATERIGIVSASVGIVMYVSRATPTIVALFPCVRDRVIEIVGITATENPEIVIVIGIVVVTEKVEVDGIVTVTVSVIVAMIVMISVLVVSVVSVVVCTSPTLVVRVVIILVMGRAVMHLAGNICIRMGLVRRMRK